jgi:hypothetical protein
MSYCRWGDDCFQSDIYCYEGESGFQIHIAARKYVSNKPRPTKPSGENNLNDWFNYYKACSKWVRQAEVEPIGLPYDGESYGFETKAECLEKLIELREIGYRVPQYAIDLLSEPRKEDK